MDLAQYAVFDSDIEFIRKKELDGNLVLAKTLNSTTTGEKAAYTPASGKTFHFLKAWFVPQTNDAHHMNADIENDGTTIDSLYFQQTTGVSNGKFESNVFDSLVGDGAKKFRINVTIVTSVKALDYYLMGWIEDT